MNMQAEGGLVNFLMSQLTMLPGLWSLALFMWGLTYGSSSKFQTSLWKFA